MAGLFLDLRMERAMCKIIDQQLLSLRTKEETLEQPRRIRIRRAAEYATRNDDQRRAFGRIDDLDRLALVAEQQQFVVVAVAHPRPPPQQEFFRGAPRRLHRQPLWRGKLLKI